MSKDKNRPGLEYFNSLAATDSETYKFHMRSIDSAAAIPGVEIDIDAIKERTGNSMLNNIEKARIRGEQLAEENRLSWAEQAKRVAPASTTHVTSLGGSRGPGRSS